MTHHAKQRIEDRAAFDFIRYANCWEDADILCAALQPAPGKRILSIASAGDNAMALAGEGADVIAADLNVSQISCVELRRAAIRRLDYEDVLGFLGVRDSRDRLDTYQDLEKDLSTMARGFWVRNQDAITTGFIHTGKFERYFHTFRRRILPLVHSHKTIARLLKEKDEAARHSFYNQKWNNWRWRLLFRIFYSRYVMGKMGRDPEFFRYVEGSVSDRILERARYALTVLPTHANPYLDYILNGNYTQALPRYLRPQHFDAVRNGLDRITLHHGPIDEAGQKYGNGGFDAFNLSDIFEYVSPEVTRDLYGSFLDVANKGARFAYWNTLVPRSCPAAFKERVISHDDVATTLFAKDLAFFYCTFVVEGVSQ